MRVLRDGGVDGWLLTIGGAERVAKERLFYREAGIEGVEEKKSGILSFEGGSCERADFNICKSPW